MAKKRDSKQLKAVKETIKKHTDSGTLNEKQIGEIMEVVRSEYDGKSMPSRDKKEMEAYIQECIVQAQNKKGVSTKEKVFAILNMASCLLTIPSFIYFARSIATFVDSGALQNYSFNTLVISILCIVLLGVSALGAALASIFMTLNRRGNASTTMITTIIFTVASAVLELMIRGVVWDGI